MAYYYIILKSDLQTVFKIFEHEKTDVHTYTYKSAINNQNFKDKL